ncbi:hypothetical protein GCM10017673_23110 [Streptosporangium violaceochromogenes]|nr:hypothetical protein GCM10017673_23110 [Streptosporangium violaceochromogenes]
MTDRVDVLGAGAGRMAWWAASALPAGNMLPEGEGGRFPAEPSTCHIISAYLATLASRARAPRARTEQSGANRGDAGRT